MKIRELWKKTGCLGTLIGEGDPNIETLLRDSRQVKQNCLFLCRQGASFDSHLMIPEIFESGAEACVVHRPLSGEKICWHVSPFQEGEIASAFYDNPSEKLTVLGITGTDGKSTTAWLTTQLLKSLGHSVACLGTLGVWSGNSWEPWGMTTPETEVLQKTMAQLLDQGITHVVMEVSSHGLSAGRVQGIDFDAVALTNLGRDHLDDYGSLEAYHQAKEKLFELQKNPDKQVRPHDSAGSAQTRPGDNLHVSVENQQIKIEWDDWEWTGNCSLEGEHNFRNLEVALGLVGCLEKKEDAVKGISSLRLLPGRWQWVEESHRQVMIDYAHTPDALETLLKNLRNDVTGELHILFGCGGQRDSGKRPLMGQVASQWADKVWVTDDNPRRENADEIRRAICQKSDPQKTVNIPNRRQAIKEALATLKPEDVLVISGKGHETGQIIGDKIYPFDDVEVANQLLREKEVR